MQMLSKTPFKQNIHPVVMDQNWTLPSLPRGDEDELYALTETRAALAQAETIMRAQEDRIRALETAALMDELTGLYNERGFKAAFGRELGLSRRDTECAGILVMINLDAFTRINEEWGHQSGDACLCAVANTLRETVRSGDIVARLGGDQFAMLLTGMDAETGTKRMERLEQAFNKKTLVLHKRMSLHASFGFAAYCGTDTMDSVMRAAEMKMSAHKAKADRLIPSTF